MISRNIFLGIPVKHLTSKDTLEFVHVESYQTGKEGRVSRHDEILNRHLIKLLTIWKEVGTLDWHALEIIHDEWDDREVKHLNNKPKQTNK